MSAPDGLPRWGFADPGPLRDELTAAALSGKKTATSSLVVEYEIESEAIPRVGDRSVLVDTHDQPVAIAETTEVRIVRLADVDDAFAIDEGEDYADAAEYRAAHERYWNGHIDAIRTGLADPSFALTDDTMIVAERFRIVEVLEGQPAPGA